MSELPPPMTPPDCDLRGMPYMPMDMIRLFDSDFYILSSGDEFKAAVTLWGRSFLQVPAASLPDDDLVMAHLSGAGDRWPAVREMVRHGWVKCSDGRLYHPVVAHSANIAWKRHLGLQAKLLRWRDVSWAAWQVMRGTVFARDRYTCVYCGTKSGPFECDHIFPFSRGGATSLENLATACRACNRSKSNSTLDQWRRG